MKEKIISFCEATGWLVDEMDMKTIAKKVKENTHFKLEKPLTKKSSLVELTLETEDKNTLDQSIKGFKKIIDEHGIKRARIKVETYINISNDYGE